MAGVKPRVWGCDCYVAVLDEIRGKVGPKPFQEIFVGYEEHRLGWRVHDLSGRYSFSNDVIFNENISGRLGIPRSLPPAISDTRPISSSQPLRDRPRTRTAAGQVYNDVLELKRLCREERQCKILRRNDIGNGGAADAATGGANGDAGGSADGGADGGASVGAIAASFSAAIDLSPSLEAIESLTSFVDSSLFPDQIDTSSLLDVENNFIHSLFSSPILLRSKLFHPLFRSLLIYLNHLYPIRKH